MGQRGGFRPGAGRPKRELVAIRESKDLQAAIFSGGAAGLRRLAKDYDKIMTVAIKEALGGYSLVVQHEDGTNHIEMTRPDRTLIKALLDLMPKIMGAPAVEQSTPIGNLINDLREKVNVSINQVNNYGNVETSSPVDLLAIGGKISP